MKNTLQSLHEHKPLNEEDAYAVLRSIGAGEANPAQLASFLTVYLMRPITLAEFVGFRKAMLDMCIRVHLDEYNPMDVCGTGGDNKNTFNISTTSAFVAAGAGARIAKHGNYAVSSASGSSNVLETLGITFSNDEQKLKNQIEKAGICILHAPLFHPAMKNIGPVRKELGLKTIFNMLGPTSNPAMVKNQLTGVYNQELMRLYKYVFQSAETNHCIIHSLDGYDEISLTGAVKMVSQEGERILQPEDFGFEKLQAEQLAGGKDHKESAEIFIEILENRTTPARKAVTLANAAMAIKTWYADKQMSLGDAMLAARESLDSGKALAAFKTLQSLS